MGDTFNLTMTPAV